MHRPQPFSPSQRSSVVYGILSFILILLICQVWLVTATVQAFLGGDDSVVLPAALASLFCLLLNLGLLRYIYKLEKNA